ncbi:Magnesium-dependent phosphatase 1-like [Oopsacas minuta]|uniref:Magnesium-dependent phosphatase 1-like n=1 Tax=Oopsacas minuta TaxID=111878 RepID=A0AAV7KC96_9METZ|nr:Magnesium-dependent phosphatase 1-like [Oopsacas minuta]
MASANILMENESQHILPKILPKLVIFDLDYTLWPFWADTLYDLNYKSDGKGGIIGSRSSDKKKLYKDTRELLEILSKAKIPIAAASRTDDPPMAKNLLKLFDIDKYFSYKEIYPGCKVDHFKQFHKYSQFPYKEMLFFDDEERNIQDVSLLGVTCVHVDRGITKREFLDGLNLFSRKENKK